MRCYPPKGRPSPSVSWLQNGKPIDPTVDKNFIVSDEGRKMIVVAARLADSANYTCVADNVASKRFSEPATITVYGKPLFSLLNVVMAVTFHPKEQMGKLVHGITYTNLIFAGTKIILRL